MAPRPTDQPPPSPNSNNTSTPSSTTTTTTPPPITPTPHHPSAAYQARPKATPTGRDDTHYRVRHDRVRSGRVSLRVNGHMHHIGLGRPLDGTRVILLIADLDVRVIHTDTGEIIRTLTLDPTKRYHGTGRPPGGPPGPRKTRRTTR